VGLVLLAVITNVASLQLARGAARFRELAVRAAIGGSRARITRQLFIESLLLGLIGGAGGLALAFWGTRALRGLATRRFPRIDLIQVDGAVLFFVLGISFLSVVGFGLVPALRYARTPARRVMEEGAGGRDSGRYSLRRTLVGLQTAVAVVLFVGAGLLFKSYRVVGSVDLGFDPDRVLTLATWLPVPNEAGQGGYEVPERRIGFFDRVLDEMIQISGVEHAGMTSILPFHGTSRLPVGVKGGRDADGAGLPLAESRIVSGGYFRAMGIELLSGRTFRRSDALGGPLVAIVNRAFVERYFAGEDPLGQAIQVRIPQSWWLEVVGVVEDVTHGPMGRPPAETVYTSFRQYGSAMIAMSFVLNTSDRPEAYADAAVAALQRVDPDVPAFDVAPMGQLLSEARRQERLQTVFFALVSLLTGALAALGVYGVVSSSVAQRSGEIGVRLALGGARTGILRMLLSEGMRLGALGASTGLVLAVASTLLLRSFLHGVQPTDLGIMAGAVALTLSLVTLASLVPALDATRIDPAEIIKAD
jgi:predicted permease